MKNTSKKNRAAALVISPEERKEYISDIEKAHPGFIYENEKLTTMVRILTAVRVMFGIFYVYVTSLFELPISQGIVILVSSFFFFIWYSWMLRSGKIIAVMMLFFRGVGIATGGASLLTMIFWLPFALNFTMILSLVIEFIEAVFCIYVLFNGDASQTVKLNKSMDEGLLSRRASKKMMGELAEYSNDCGGEENGGDGADGADKSS